MASLELGICRHLKVVSLFYRMFNVENYTSIYAFGGSNKLILNSSLEEKIKKSKNKRVVPNPLGLTLLGTHSGPSAEPSLTSAARNPVGFFDSLFLV